MKGEIKALTEEEKEEKRLVGKALKQKEQEEEWKKHDQQLYRPHGQGLDTGNDVTNLFSDPIFQPGPLHLFLLEGLHLELSACQSY